ncbi:MAG: MGMT family protein [Candidatus Hydrogenedentes bacterium]|nr:MGMT family protein [Candidatus Hydrogenedentota bacterium]
MGMKQSRVPWANKLRPDMKPVVGDDPKGRGRMLIPTPMLVANEMKRVRKGRTITVSELRDRLARQFGADFTCPLVTGIFYNIIAGAAEESIAAGKKPLAPYWRIIRDDGSLSPKTPFGPERQAEHLRNEGHCIADEADKFIVALRQAHDAD